MTTMEIELLMNKYFDNDLPDREAQKLFSLLSTSQESRTLFADMKMVHESLTQLPTFESSNFPNVIDQKFALLHFGATRKPLLERRFTISIPSALLSMIAVLLVGAVVLLSFDTKSVDEQVLHQQIVDQYQMLNNPIFLQH